jgi:predicted CoA-binding protein
MTVAAFSRSPSARQRDKNSLMETPSYSHDYIRAILERTRTIATVGVSLNDVRPSYYVARYLKLKGYKIEILSSYSLCGAVLNDPPRDSLSLVPT